MIKPTNICFELGYRCGKNKPNLVLSGYYMSHTFGCEHIEIKSCSELLTSSVHSNLPHKPPLRPVASPPMGRGRGWEGGSLPPSQLSQLVVSFGWLTPKCLMHLLAGMQRYPNTCKIIRYLPDSCCLLSLGYAALITSCLYRCVRLKYWIKVVFSWTTKIL